MHLEGETTLVRYRTYVLVDPVFVLLLFSL